MLKKDVLLYCEARYGTTPDHPWKDAPESVVLRHADSRKWYALLLRAPRRSLGLTGEGEAEALNLKCGPVLAGSLRGQPGVLPAYHMNKEHWITVLLDGPLPDEELRDLIDLSYKLTKSRR